MVSIGWTIKFTSPKRRWTELQASCLDIRCAHLVAPDGVTVGEATARAVRGASPEFRRRLLHFDLRQPAREWRRKWLALLSAPQCSQQETPPRSRHPIRRNHAGSNSALPQPPRHSAAEWQLVGEGKAWVGISSRTIKTPAQAGRPELRRPGPKGGINEAETTSVSGGRKFQHIQ